jgi:hypothetical protein
MNNIISTLLDDTLRCIALSGHTVEQIVFIGTESGYSLSWDEFASMTALHPHIGEIARDIVIEFSDGKTMWRECDFEWGCSSWAFQRPFTRPTNTVMPITILADNCWCPDELDAIQEQAIIKREAEIEARESAAAAAAFETEMALANQQRPIIHDLAGLSAALN